MANGQFDAKSFIADKVWIFFWAVVLGYTGMTFWGYTDLRAENEKVKSEVAEQVKEISNQITQVDIKAREEVKFAVDKLDKKIDIMDMSTDELKLKMAQNSEKINYIQIQQTEIMGILKEISKDVKKK